MKIGIVGARLAGSYAAWLLAARGHEVLLLDHQPSREKPCGGGVTGKALRRMPWFARQALPHTTIRRLKLFEDRGRTAVLGLSDPIHIFSRSTLDSWLRERAVEAGARFAEERAVAFEALGRGWGITTAASRHEVDLLVGADGAASSVRRATSRPLEAADLSLALGFYLPGLRHPDTVVAEFQEPRFSGYLWSFPRVDHTSVGILQLLDEANASDLRRRVAEFIAARYPDASGEARFYAARIPCLRARTLVLQQVCGPSWALLGDAAGFADAITAEGIYFALRSAELLAESVARGSVSSYEDAWRRDFGGELEHAALWRERFYAGRFAGAPFTRRAVGLIARSPTVCSLTDRLVAGRISYAQLRRRLIARSLPIVIEALAAGRSDPVELVDG